jgi:hypothetical protein
MKKAKSEAHKTLSLLLKRDGISTELISNGAKEEKKFDEAIQASMGQHPLKVTLNLMLKPLYVTTMKTNTRQWRTQSHRGMTKLMKSSISVSEQSLHYLEVKICCPDVLSPQNVRGMVMSWARLMLTLHLIPAHTLLNS